jgi:hypothetical protein
MRALEFCILAVIVLPSFTRLAAAQTVSVDGNLLVSWCDANINRERVGDWAMKGGSCLGRELIGPRLSMVLNVAITSAQEPLVAFDFSQATEGGWTSRKPLRGP